MLKFLYSVKFYENKCTVHAFPAKKKKTNLK